MLGSYFYNATIKRVVSVFGTIFNNITVARHNGNTITNVSRVPLSYGPRSKFLARIREEANLTANKIGIKLPRMSFEITSIDYDAAAKLNKMNKIVSGNEVNTRTSIFQSVPYTISMELNIYAKNQDDALQIVEQIIPTFTPDYTVTIKDIEGPGSKTDVPFILNSVTFQDDYDGDFTTRRAIIYTLAFTIKARFAGGIGDKAIIRRVKTDIADFNVKDNRRNLNNSPTGFLEQIGVSADSPSATVRKYVSFVDSDNVYTVNVAASNAFDNNELVVGLTSGFAGLVVSTSGQNITMTNLEGLFTVGETLVGQNSPATSTTVNSITLQ